MKKNFLIAVALSFALASTAAVALPKAEEDIHTGDDLIAACHALTAPDTSDAGVLASTACRHFLGTMVLRVYKATQPGMPTEFSRIGPKGDETACFRLPSSLPFTDLAGYIASYYQAHPELGERPAFELAARTLAAKYPCTEDAPRP
jgi:hypothetical protein